MLATRPGGIFFFVYVVAWWSLALWRARARTRELLRAATALAWVTAGAWLVMLSCWPWGQVSPIFNPLRGIVVASRFSFALTTLFLGGQVPARNPPLGYLPVWFGMQLPELYFVAAAAAVAGYGFGRRRQINDGRLAGSSQRARSASDLAMMKSVDVPTGESRFAIPGWIFAFWVSSSSFPSSRP